jgi:hypothetical protein
LLQSALSVSLASYHALTECAYCFIVFYLLRVLMQPSGHIDNVS